ncbi:alpha/beta fold hydrolase [Actinoplanes solisilvae]|uniref:alpha/beta fold hydrolase n=1 Tax=Actinoplanes solisilvae TaxID=2486853 RepID=UPI000FD9FADB|nr:alpha/beta hydrolase [Actinoplanes solisilvae]
MSRPLVLLHGLTYDKRHWDPVLGEIAKIDPGRTALALDLPGHGDALRRDSYGITDVAGVLHDQVVAAGIDGPVVLAGHSIGAVVATRYAALYPAAGVLNVDQVLLPGRFFATLRAAEPTLRSPQWRQVWNQMLAGMALDTLPPDARSIVDTATDPRPDLLLGYWDEVLHGDDAAIRAERTADLRTLATNGTEYEWVTAKEPPAPYVQWLTAALPQVKITVIPGSHFPHLAGPARIARILTDDLS